jgi:hypothetical protein
VLCDKATELRITDPRVVIVPSIARFPLCDNRIDYLEAPMRTGQFRSVPGHWRLINRDRQPCLPSSSAALTREFARAGQARRPGADVLVGSAGGVVGAPVSEPGVEPFEHAVRPDQRGGHRVGVGVNRRQARTGDNDEIADTDQRLAAWTRASSPRYVSIGT